MKGVIIDTRSMDPLGPGVSGWIYIPISSGYRVYSVHVYERSLSTNYNSKVQGYFESGGILGYTISEETRWTKNEKVPLVSWYLPKKTNNTGLYLENGGMISIRLINTSTAAVFDNIYIEVYGQFEGVPFEADSISTFRCSPSPATVGDNLQIFWEATTASAGTLTGYRLKETTNNVYYPSSSSVYTTNSVNIYMNSNHANKTLNFILYAVGTGTNNINYEIQLKTLSVQVNALPVHITGAGTLSSLTRGTGLFGNTNGYYIDSSNTGSATLSWTISTGGSNITRYYSILKDGVEIYTNLTARSYAIPYSQLPAAGQSATYAVKCYSSASTSGYNTNSITVYGVGLSPSELSLTANNTFTTTATISCNIPTINVPSGASSSSITRTWTTQYQKRGSTTWTTFTPASSTTIGTTQNFVFDPTGIISLNESIKFKVTCSLYYDTSSMGIEATGETSTYSVYGQEPNQLDSLIFSLDSEDYYGTAPIDTYTVSTKNWTLDNFKFGANNKIYIKINLGEVVNSTSYNRVAELTWKRGNENIGTISCILDESLGLDYVELILSPNGGTSESIVTYSGTPIECLCANLFNTNITAPVAFLAMAKSQLVSDTTTYLSANTYGLNNSTHFTLASKPLIFSNGTSIPFLNTNEVLNVNFSTKSEPPIDYRLDYIRAQSLNGVELYGYKVYTYMDGVETLITSSVLNESDANGQFDTTNSIFIPSSFAPVGNMAGEGNNVYLQLDILSDPDYLKSLLNNGNSLSSLDNVKNFEYRISIVDRLKQESSEKYSFNVSYDFRIPSEMIESPIINFTNYVQNSSYTPLIRNIVYSGSSYVENALCFHGQSSEDSTVKDWIIYEWYPALKASDQATNPAHYQLIDGKYYLLEGYTDPNSYYIFKWNFGNTGLVTNSSRKLKLTPKTTGSTTYDYYPIIEEKTYTNESGASSTARIIKYIGKYGINLRNIQEDELSYLCIVPAYTSEGEGEKISYTSYSYSNAQKNHLCYNSNTAVPIYIARFTTPNTLITGMERTSEVRNWVNFKVNDYGSSRKLNAIMINADNCAGYGPLKRMALDFQLLYQGEPVSDKNGNLVQTFDSDINTDLQMLEKFQFSDDFELNEYDLLDKNAYYINIMTTIECNRCDIFINSSGDFELNGSIESISSLTSQYMAPAFGTLSLRKNKVGINKSALTWIEETLSVVGKDRCDIEVTPGVKADYYQNIIGVYSSEYSRMPNYDGTTVIPAPTARGSYIGFYDAYQGEETWLGSIGFEEDGTGYIISSRVVDGVRVYKKTKIGEYYTAGDGITLDNEKIGHTNVITPQTEEKIYAVTIDKNGHINYVGNGYRPDSLGSKSYVLDFSSTDWGGTDTKTITIEAETHGCGLNPTVDVYYLETGNTNYTKAWGIYTSADWKVEIDTDGNVIVTTLTAFDGRIIVK